MPSWQTSDDGYDAKHYYTQSSDAKGHHAKMQIKVPTNIAGEIARLVQSGIIPEYDTAQAMVRDAIIHRLHMVNEWIKDEDLTRTITMWTIHEHAIAKASQREQFKEMMAGVDEHCQFLMNRGLNNDVREYVNDLLEKNTAVPDELRAEYIANLEAKLKVVGGWYET
jgi:hypothetical protein